MSIVLPDSCLFITRKPSRFFSTIVLGVCLLLGFSLPAVAERKAEPQLDGMEALNAQTAMLFPFEGGVKAYREGEYRQARKIFDALHRQVPENTKITYYLAITEAQLGRFQQAQKFYGEIITLDPNGETATLAKEGLKYLPPEASLDLPPRFNQPVVVEKMAAAQSLPGQPNGQPVGASAASSVSPQDLLAWQMMMGQNNNGMGGGNNPMGSFMPNMMMGGNTNAPNATNGGGMSGFDPNMMSTMMMNQMMQNMNPGGDQNENR